MRITHNILISNFLRNLNDISNRIQKTQYQLATGKKVNKPSDGPMEISQILTFQSTSARLAQYLKNVDDGASQVGYVDTIIQAINEDTGRARDLAIRAANDSMNKYDRSAIGQEINLLLESTLANANTKFRDRFCFAGWKCLTKPFEAIYNARTGEIEDIVYKGDRGSIDRLVGDDDRLSVNITGDKLFMKQTYTRIGHALPLDEPLGFEGRLTINGVNFQVTANQTLRDIASMLNLKSSQSYVYASISESGLKLESMKAVSKFTIFDNQNNQLLENLGIHLSGAFNTGRSAPILPIVDSTPAIFNGSGPVANLVYNSSNNVLNIFLGADANGGVSKAANIFITEGTYSSVADLIVELQTQIDKEFGTNRIKVSDSGGGTLRLETVATGNEIDQGDLVIGGTYFGIADTASNSSNLNLIAAVGNAPPTYADTAGTDGNDKIIIDLGSTASKNGIDEIPQIIDLRGSMITTVDDLIDEIRYQIFQNNVLRGAVEVRLKAGRVHFETVQKGAGILANDFLFAEGATGTLSALGLSDVPIKAQILGSPPSFPFIVVAGLNDSLTFDLGPSISNDGTDLDPITIKIPPGIYNNILGIYNALVKTIQGNMSLNGAIEINLYGPPGSQYMVISSVKAGSGVRGEDLRLGGALAGTLGFPVGNATAGGGPSDGQGIELEPQNIFNTLISLRDDCYGVVGTHSKVLSAQNSQGSLLELLEGDEIIVRFDGNTYKFSILSVDTFEDFIRSMQDIFKNRALVQLTSDGRIRIQNLETAQMLGLSITAKSRTGEDRTLFNEIFAELPSSLPGLTASTTKQILDPRRYLRLGNEDLAESDLDQQNLLQHIATIGARANRLTTITNLFTASDLNIKELRNSIEAVNTAEIVTYLTQQTLVLQSILGIGAKILPPSLFDFLQ